RAGQAGGLNAPGRPKEGDLAAFVHPAHRTIWLLLPIAILVATACSQPTAYNGPQPRTPVKDIPASGQLKNFELIANNPLLDPKYNLPRVVRDELEEIGRA